MDDEDTAPLTELARQAAVHHEIFTAYAEAGFTRTEALHILTSIIVAGISRPQA
jgi:hypothetical protein